MKASSHDEFREFVAMRSTALLRLAVLITGGDRHAAEDLLQIALMKAYGRWGSIEQTEAYDGGDRVSRGVGEAGGRVLLRPGRRSVRPRSAHG